MNINDTITLDDLVRSYLRFKEWMHHDVEHSAYSAKEIIVMQALFGTTYIEVPRGLKMADYEELLACMELRLATMRQFNEHIHRSSDEGQTDALLDELEKSSFKSKVDYFGTLFDAILQAAVSYQPRRDEQDIEQVTIDTEPIDDYFKEVDEGTFESIREFIVAEHPETERMIFPKEKLYILGLPRVMPDPISHVLE